MEETKIVKVLAVDDDPQTLEYISAALDQPGVRITSVADSKSAFELFVTLRPQLVLLDLMMPNIGGMQFLETMVAADPAGEGNLVTSAYTTESAGGAIQK